MKFIRIKHVVNPMLIQDFLYTLISRDLWFFKFSEENFNEAIMKGDFGKGFKSV